MAQVLRNKLTDLVPEQGAEKRAGDLATVSLDSAIDGSEDGKTLAESLATTESSHPEEGGDAHRHLHIDLFRALALLTPAHQHLCRMLGE